MKRVSKKQLAVFGLVTAMAGVGLVVSQSSAAGALFWTPPPQGFYSYITYTANETYDPSTPPADPRFTNCGQGVCSGDFFQEEIMGRTPAEVAALEANAKAFILARFGLDVDDPALAGRIFFTDFMIDPRGGYRARVISGMRVPRSGYRVWDGGWNMVVLDPNGVELGGEFAGRTAPAGSLIVFGEYAIDTRRRRGRRYINISYRAGSPVEFGQSSGLGAFSCELLYGRQEATQLYDLSVEHRGLAQGTVTFQPQPNGEVRDNWRNAITFSRRGGN